MKNSSPLFWLILIACPLFTSCFGGIRVTELVTRTATFSPDGTVELYNVNGNIIIKGWDKNEVSVEATKGAWSQERLALIKVNVEATADLLVIKTEFPKQIGFSSLGRVDYVVNLPRKALLRKIQSVNSTVIITGMESDVNVNNVNGNVTASPVVTNAHLESVNGFITATLQSPSSGAKVHASTVNGGVEFILPADFSAKVDASLVNGRISHEFGEALPQSRHGQLHGTLGAGDAHLSAEVVNGKISINQRKPS